MSQIYKEMNKTGKYLFWQGLIFQVGGLIVMLFGNLTTRSPILGVAMLAIGLSNILVAQFDKRCNIKNNSKGELLASLEKKQTSVGGQ